MQRLRIAVAGYIAQYPLGGLTWHYLQYVLGLSRLGHDVYYVEDTGRWPYHPAPDTGAGWTDSLDYLAGAMASAGLAGRWAFRFGPADSWHGLPDARRREVLATADLVLDVSGCLGDPARYRGRARLAYVDTDPVFTQVWLLRHPDRAARVGGYDRHFTFAATLPAELTAAGPRWRPTRQPVVLDEWATAAAPRRVITTVMNWDSYGRVHHRGRRLGQKGEEFHAYFDLPGAVPEVPFELSVAPGKVRRTPTEQLVEHGWRVVPAAEAVPSPAAYRRYVQHSLAEWSVAKHGYVALRCGWFSERSACYLAAGRPVVVQDTGFSDHLAVGEGLLAFSTPTEAADGVRAVLRDYERHAKAARHVAEACFDHRVVLEPLLEEALGG